MAQHPINESDRQEIYLEWENVTSPERPGKAVDHIFNKYENVEIVHESGAGFTYIDRIVGDIKDSCRCRINQGEGYFAVVSTEKYLAVHTEGKDAEQNMEEVREILRGKKVAKTMRELGYDEEEFVRSSTPWFV